MKKITLYATLMLIFCATLTAQQIMHINNANITIQNGATLYINGGMAAEPGSSIQNNGTVVFNTPGAGAASFLDNAVFPYYYGPGTFLFTGAGVHNISTKGFFGRLHIDKQVVLHSDIYALKWYLQNGRIATGPFKAVVIDAAADAIEADAANPGFTASWFEGNLLRSVTPASVNSYLFPVGSATRVYFALFDNLVANPLTGISSIQARFAPKPGTDAGLNVIELGTSYTSVNDEGVWHFSTDVSPSGGNYDLALSVNGFSGLTDNSFAPLLRSDASAAATDWQVPAASLLPASNTLGRTVAGGIARRNNMTAFGQVGIGMTDRALPLTLLSFTAHRSGNNVLLKWITSNESNTSHFDILKAQQPGVLNYFDRVAAMGNTTGALSYNFTDRHPYAGVNLYRLKMVDRDNRFTLSPVIKIDFNETGSFKIYPNPVLNNEIFIELPDTKAKDVKLFAANGIQVQCRFTVTGNSLIKLSLPATLSRGLYTIQVVTEKGKSNSMVILQ